jgi:hypothetical protein
MRVLTLAVTPAISTTFLEHDLFLYFIPLQPW